ncbi:MAG: response regulator transcription factor FixJ [Bauldia sp.]|nr:response regulator transcription factor FixJ [Bauldia sp.]
MPDESIAHIIDDDDALRDSLAFLLSSADIPVAAYPSAVEFLEALPGISSGCVVTDIRMPGMSGMELLKHLKETGSPLQVIVMTGHGDVPLAVEAMRLGAVDFLEKPFDDEAMIASVRSALARQKAADHGLAVRNGIQQKLEALTLRERQVLDGLVAGNPNKRIAHDLGISPRTVEIYRANVMTKMQAGSLSDLVRMTLIADPSQFPLPDD